MAAVRHVVFGTAGHIDHGKTTLVRALTGVDCDRLPEEKARGITIELGFAQLTDGDTQLHFVDVPGHERLVHTMIAGAAGIDLALLVVAADEGIKPQTREHLEVIRLMGVPAGAVVLTKTDLVDADLVTLAAEEVRELLADTPFATAPVVPVSAHTGAGLDELRRVMLELAAHARPRQVEGRPFRLAVDRVFTLTGVGTVVTGTSLWGRLDVGAEVLVEPGALRARARRLHCHGLERDRVEAGERVAVNLAAVPTERLRRGDQVLSPGPWQPSRMVTLRLELLASATNPLEEGSELELHALATRVEARVERLSRPALEPGTSGVAVLLLDEPALLFPGDRAVLRRPSPVNTFAGGVVLDAHLPRPRRRDAAALEQLPPVHRQSWPELLGSWVDRAGLAGVSVEELAGRLGALPEAIEAPLGRLLADHRVHALATQPARLVREAALTELAAAAAAELARRLAGEEVSAGVPARDFAAAILPRAAQPLAGVFLEELRRRSVVELTGGRVVPVGREQHMTEQGEELTRRVDACYRDAGLDPPSPGEVAERLSARPATVEGICRFLVTRGRLVRLEGKFLIHRAVLDEVASGIRSWSVASFEVAEFKERFGLTRKLAIPILEWLDSERVTVRHGASARRVLGRGGAGPATTGQPGGG